MVAGIFAGGLAFVTVDSGVEVLTNFNVALLSLIMWIAIIIIYFISYLISCRIFERKEV